MPDPRQLAELIKARAEKKIDTLDLFRPQSYQEPFFRAMTGENVLQCGLGGGNRAGKSICAAVWFAALLLNRPVTLRDGTKLHMRPDRWKSEGMQAWIIGLNWEHIGKTLWRLLFTDKSGIRLIRDRKTKQWRAYDPSLPEDKANKHRTRPAPPLIRMTDIVGGKKGIAWEDRKATQFRSMEFVNGSTLRAFASTGERPQGDACNVIWMDERLHDESWYSELLMRLLDETGRLLWTSWPDSIPSPTFSEIVEKAKEQDGKPDQRTFYIMFDGDLSPFTSGEHRDQAFEMMDEDTRIARSKGVLNQDRWRVYARFSPFIHKADNGQDKLSAAIEEKNGIPGDWTRYMILDPGTANPAVLWVAVPPPVLGDFIVPYDELYIHYKNAKEIAQLIAAKNEGITIEDIIADAHACRQTPMGFGGTVGENYQDEFAAAGVYSNRRGKYFSYGSDSVLPRIMRVQGTMNIRSDGTTRLRVYKCPVLCKQLQQYKWGADPRGNPTDKPADHQQVDVAQCLEYFVSRDDCGYIKPPPPKKRADPLAAQAVFNVFAKACGIDPNKKSPQGAVFCGSGVPGGR